MFHKKNIYYVIDRNKVIEIDTDEFFKNKSHEICVKFDKKKETCINDD